MGFAEITGVKELTGEASTHEPSLSICLLLLGDCCYVNMQCSALTGTAASAAQAYMLVRKQNKKVAVFELNITLSWRGHWAEEAKDVEGDVKVIDWSSIDPEEYQFEVSVAAKDSATDAGANLKAAVQGLRGNVLGRLQQYVQDINQL